MITKEQFDAVYDKHLPNKFVSFMYKYFSKGTTNSNMTPSNILMGALIGSFLLGYIPSILEIETPLIGIATIFYFILLTIIALALFIAVIMNRIRLKKIYTELGVSLQEYNQLVEKYYPTE